jgi:hypothetical protein
LRLPKAFMPTVSRRSWGKPTMVNTRKTFTKG